MILVIIPEAVCLLEYDFDLLVMMIVEIVETKMKMEKVERMVMNMNSLKVEFVVEIVKTE